MIAQGTKEWKALRCGKVTASRMADLLATTKTGYGASRANYLAELLTERLTGRPVDTYVNAAMAHGTETEPQARAAYEFATGYTVALAEFVPHPSIPMSGASPDGYVNDDGLLEIKCPATATHIETLLGGAIPKKYADQMQWQMACTGRRWCDFVSFDPRLPPRMQMFCKRLERDDVRIKAMEGEVEKFLAELDRTITALNILYPEQAAA